MNIVHVVDQTLMKQSFAHITAQQRDTTDTQSSTQVSDQQQRLTLTKAANIVQQQAAGTQHHNARQSEQHLLKQRMIYHVQHCTTGCHGAMVTKQRGTGKAKNDEAHLTHRRASEGSL